MRAIGYAIVVIAMIHVVAAIGLVAWLYGTDRLSQQRLVDVYDTFTKTIEQEQADAEAAAAERDEQQKQAERDARLAGQGPAVESAGQRLADQRGLQNAAEQRLALKQKQLETLQTNLMLARRQLARRDKELAAREVEFEKLLAERQQQIDDESFGKTLKLYENLSPKQVKQMFVDLMDQEQTEQVVTYLEAMKPRMAAAVLGEFKAASETSRAVELTERLRARGSNLAQKVESVH
jgi:hypothetical protein